MSTSVVQPHSVYSWKQEVSQRIAAHKSRGGWSTSESSAPAPSRVAAGSRAAQATARVAARYAHAPSYSQMQASESHVATHAAVIALQTPLPAPPPPVANVSVQAAFNAPCLWEPEAQQPVVFARSSAPDWEPTLSPARHTVPSSLDDWESEYSHIRWEPDITLRPIETVKPEQPIHANLIEFPRELVATRKMRPRRAERALAAEGLERQLSIFEVDPGPISIQFDEASTALASAWPEPEWSGIKLEVQPPCELEPQDAPSPLLELQLAPIGHRLMATLVDGALNAAVFLGLAMAVAFNVGHLPSARIVELGAASAFLLFALLYQTVFLTLVGVTPGMRYAGLSLCTFDGQIPTSAQLRSRLGALILSVVPVGLGLAWALFDDDRLCWHDRLSRTYLREG